MGVKPHKKKVVLNQKFKTIELKFNVKPTRAALGALHGSAFKWAPTKKHWFARNKKKNRDFANGLVSNPNQIELNF